MFKRALMATVTATSIIAAPTFSLADSGYDLSLLPAPVAARVAELQTHGDRYKAAIEAILREARMGDYRWEAPAAEDAHADNTNDQSALPADLAARVAVLQSYGDRYQAAIDAITREAALTPYRWETGPADAKAVTAHAPES